MIKFLAQILPRSLHKSWVFNNLWPDKFLAIKGFECESTEIMIMHIDAMMIFE